MIIGVAAVTTAPESRRFDKGLLIVKETDILLSGEKWTIVVNIALDDYTALVEDMKAIIGQMRQKIKADEGPRLHLLDIHWA